MFSVVEKQICDKPIENPIDKLVPKEGDERLQLDLGRYRSLHRERFKDIPEESYAVTVCDKLKSMTLEFGKTIDSIIKQVRNTPSPLPDDDARFIDWSDNRKTYRESFKFPVAELKDDMHERMEYLGFCPVCLASLWRLPKYTIYRMCNGKIVPQIN